MGLTFAHDNFFHTIRLQFNRSRSDIRNLYAGVTNVTVNLRALSGDVDEAVAALGPLRVALDAL